MLYLASEYELKFRVCRLLARPHGQAWAGLVLRFFWKQSWIFYFCTKKSTLLMGVFWCIVHPWGLNNPALGIASCLNFESKACLEGHMVRRVLGLFWKKKFMSIRMLCLASKSELKFLIWFFLARPQGQAWAGLVLNVFLLEYEGVMSCIKLWASFFMQFSSLGTHEPSFGGTWTSLVVCLNFESEACLHVYMVRPMLGLFWKKFEWRVEFFIFAPKGPHYWKGSQLRDPPRDL
jgi:hypothetical protein